MVQLSSHELRLNYDIGKIMLIRANFSERDKNGNIIKAMTKADIEAKMESLRDDEITQGYIWSEIVLTPQRQVLQWAIVDTQQLSSSPITPTMRLLTMQDSFLISTLSYFLMNYTYENGNYNDIDFTTGNTWLPLTYVSPWASHGVNFDLAEGCALFWIGSYISFEINKKVVVPYWDCYRHYQAPQTQATPAFPIPSAYIPQQANQHDGSVDGFYPMEPNVVLGGGRGNIVKLNLAANIPATIAPFSYVDAYNISQVLKGVLCTRGILLQNSTNVK